MASKKETRRYVASIVQDLRERITDLRYFDAASEINHYCDELEEQVGLTFESVIDAFNSLHDETRTKINDYRNELLQKAAATFSKGAREDKPPEFAFTEEFEFDKFKQELEEVSRELEKFSSENSDSLHDPHDLIEVTLETVKAEANKLTNRFRELRKKLREGAFSKRFLKFEPNRMFILSTKRIGYFNDCSTEFETPLQKVEFSEQPLQTLTHHSDRILATRIDPTGLVFSSAANKSFCAWDLKKQEQKMFSIGAVTNVTDSIEVPTSWHILTGHEDGLIIASNRQFKPMSFYAGHLMAVTSLISLRNGNFASLSRDNSIKIWAQQLDKRNRELFSISGHGCRNSKCGLGLLSNDLLVTCSDRGYVRMWEANRTALLDKFETNLEAFSLVVLPNDDIAIATVQGPIHIYDLVSRICIRTLSSSKTGSLLLHMLPNGFILAADTSDNAFLQVWDSETWKLTQEFASGHSEGISSCFYCRDSRLLATGSLDKTVKLWSLSFVN